MFSKSNILRANKTRTYSAHQNPILDVFASLSSDETKKEIQYLKQQEQIFEKHIKEVRAEYEKLSVQSQAISEKRRALEAPILSYKSACRDLEEMSKLIMNEIASVLLLGKTTATIYPGYGRSTGLYGVFKQLLSPYNITLVNKECYGQGETYNSWTINFPIHYSQPTLNFLEDNERFNQLIIDFDAQLASCYKKVEDKIVQDVLVLTKELIDPIRNGESKVFTLFKPCPFAYARLEELAELHSINLSIHESVIVASSKPNHSPKM